MSTRARPKKVVLVEEESDGVRVARKWRKVASTLSDDQRMELKKRAMTRIYGGRPHAVASRRA